MKYIYEFFSIIDIISCAEDQYMETQQETILFIVQKHKPTQNEEFTLHYASFIIFQKKEDKLQLVQLQENATTLSSLPFRVFIGKVVWNQCKDQLTDEEGATRLIYSSNLDNDLGFVDKTYKNVVKKKRIHVDDSLVFRKPMICMNRGYGKGAYAFVVCLLDIQEPYVLENHVIGIQCTENNNEMYYKKLIESLNQQKTKEFVKIYFGNNMMNITELQHMLPIYWKD